MKQTHPPVVRDDNDPVPHPVKGLRIGILDRPTGEWAAHPNGIAEWDGERWLYTDPKEGMVVFNEEEGKAFLFTNNEWVDIDE